MDTLMNADAAGPEEKAVSKGMALIAAYRAARIAGRPAMRRDLQLSRARMREELGRGKRASGTSPEATVFNAAQAEAPAGPGAGGADARAEGSVFAGLMDAAVPLPVPTPATAEAVPPPCIAETLAPALPPEASADTALPAAPMPAEPEPADDTREPPVSEAAAAAAPEPPPGLEVLGLGPGMLIRLGQLGIHTAADLAGSDVSNVRGALGDISRLINVEAWIDRARVACG
jgi:hypothetical protein